MPKLLSRLKKFYAQSKRAHLPWRRTHNPYKILVSEMMLQQTQVERVVPKYKEFLKEFSSISALAESSFPKVLKVWSGLGYNRRAKFLHEAAKIIVRDYGGKLPKNVPELESLPGIGPYIARAIVAFAYNKPEVFIETNIRTVFLYSRILEKMRIRGDKKISDDEILPLVTLALKQSEMQPRDFYAALMDYGSYLKQTGVRLNSRSKHYTKQSAFKGSARQLRGEILRQLLESPKTPSEIQKKSGRTLSEVEREVKQLLKENLIQKKRTKFEIKK